MFEACPLVFMILTISLQKLLMEYLCNCNVCSKKYLDLVRQHTSNNLVIASYTCFDSIIVRIAWWALLTQLAYLISSIRKKWNSLYVKKEKEKEAYELEKQRKKGDRKRNK